MPGAFGLPPLFLFDPVQWGTYGPVLRGKPFCRFFGTWRGHGEAAHVGRQEEGLRAANRGRSLARKAARRELLRAARALWPGVSAVAKTGRAGRPGHRAALAAALQAQGQAPSRRDLTWLLGELRRGEVPGRGGE